jgi:hypothetical protein
MYYCLLDLCRRRWYWEISVNNVRGSGNTGRRRMNIEETSLLGENQTLKSRPSDRVIMVPNCETRDNSSACYWLVIYRNFVWWSFRSHNKIRRRNIRLSTRQRITFPRAASNRPQYILIKSNTLAFWRLPLTKFVSNFKSVRFCVITCVNWTFFARVNLIRHYSGWHTCWLARCQKDGEPRSRVPDKFREWDSSAIQTHRIKEGAEVWQMLGEAPRSRCKGKISNQYLSSDTYNAERATGETHSPPKIRFFSTFPLF